MADKINSDLEQMKSVMSALNEFFGLLLLATFALGVAAGIVGLLLVKGK